MNTNILSSSRSLSRLVAILIIVLIQLPAVSPALDFGTSPRPDADIFSIASQSNLISPLTVFSNATSFTVADFSGTPGVASLYPSPITVSGQAGTISDLNVTISNVTSSRGRDLDFLLIGPGGQSFVFWADAGGVCAISGANVTFDDSAGSQLPNLISDPCPPGTAITTGSYRPTNGVPTAGETDVFPSPAPAGPYNVPAPAGAATLASVFNGISPNGTWNLYVVDDQLGGGTHTVGGGWSLDITTVGGIDPTTTTIGSSVNPSLVGQSVSFTSTTTNNTTTAAVTTGTVTFTNNGVNIAGCVALPVNGSGQAVCTTSALAEGTRIIQASYSGTATLGTSSASLTQVVNSPTVVSGALFCNNGGLTIVDASTSAPVYPSNITVSGLFGTISTVKTRVNGFTAPRPGNIDFLLVGPTSSAFQFMSDIGDSVTPATNLNFIFDDAAATQPPQAALSSGTFRPTDYNPASDPDTYPAPAPAAFARPAPAGAATFTTAYGTTNPNGTWKLFAADDGVGGGNSTITGWCVDFTISPFATTTGVTSSANPSVFGQSVTFTATVSSAGGTPTGNVQFLDNGVPIGGTVALNGSGQASFTTSSLSVGNHPITAQYQGVTLGAGGGGFATSTGSLSTNPQVVNKANTTTAVASSSNPSGTNTPVNFTATVSPVAPGAGTRTGTVTIFRGGDPVCPNLAVNASGQASCFITFTINGNYNITAVYSGDGNFNGSNNNASPLVQQAIGPTAANTNVSGRVLDSDGRGVSGARISMQNQEGELIWAISNPFGYYRFVDVPAGQIYLVTAVHKRYVFEPRTINLSDELTGLDFTPVSESRQDGPKEQRLRGGRRSP